VGSATGAQGLKMGMADPVSAGQVKKGYMKTIARVHPDKLNASNSTLEQRMLVNLECNGTSSVHSESMSVDWHRNEASQQASCKCNV